MSVFRLTTPEIYLYRSLIAVVSRDAMTEGGYHQVISLEDVHGTEFPCDFIGYSGPIPQIHRGTVSFFFFFFLFAHLFLPYFNIMIRNHQVLEFSNVDGVTCEYYEKFMSHNFKLEVTSKSLITIIENSSIVPSPQEPPTHFFKDLVPNKKG